MKVRNWNKEPKRQTNKGGRSLKLTVEEMEKSVAEYLAQTLAENKLPTLSGLSLALDVAAETISDYGKRPAYVKALKKVTRVGEEMLRQRLWNSEKVLANQMFIAKAQFGWRDNSNIDITSDGKPLGVVVLPKRGR